MLFKIISFLFNSCSLFFDSTSYVQDFFNKIRGQKRKIQTERQANEIGNRYASAVSAGDFLCHPFRVKNILKEVTEKNIRFQLLYCHGKS